MPRPTNDYREPDTRLLRRSPLHLATWSLVDSDTRLERCACPRLKSPAGSQRTKLQNESKEGVLPRLPPRSCLQVMLRLRVSGKKPFAVSHAGINVRNAVAFRPGELWGNDQEGEVPKFAGPELSVDC